MCTDTLGGFSKRIASEDRRALLGQFEKQDPLRRALRVAGDQIARASHRGQYRAQDATKRQLDTTDGFGSHTAVLVEPVRL